MAKLAATKFEATKVSNGRHSFRRVLGCRSRRRLISRFAPPHSWASEFSTAMRTKVTGDQEGLRSRAVEQLHAISRIVGLGISVRARLSTAGALEAAKLQAARISVARLGISVLGSHWLLAGRASRCDQFYRACICFSRCGASSPLGASARLPTRRKSIGPSAILKTKSALRVRVAHSVRTMPKQSSRWNGF